MSDPTRAADKADRQKSAEQRSDDEGGPKQRVNRMPADEDIGPHFPSGMSAPEAAAAGADANLTDEQKAIVRGERNQEPSEQTQLEQSSRKSGKE